MAAHTASIIRNYHVITCFFPNLIISFPLLPPQSISKPEFHFTTLLFFCNMTQLPQSITLVQ